MDSIINIIWTLIALSFAYGIFVVFLPSKLLTLNMHIFSLDIGSIRYCGLIFIIAGAVINLKCYWDLIFSGRGTPDPLIPTSVLVAKGLYQFVRNPVYVGFFLILFGESILFVSSLLLFYSFLWFLLLSLIVKFIEEPSLRQRFGKSYDEYLVSVPRWIPDLSAKRDKSKIC